MEGFNGCLFDRADHAFGLPVGPRVIWLGQPVLNVVLQAHTTEDMREGQTLCATFALDELDAVVGQDGVDLVRHPPDQRFQKADCNQLGGLAADAREDQLGCAVDGDIDKALPPS